MKSRKLKKGFEAMEKLREDELSKNPFTLSGHIYKQKNTYNFGHYYKQKLTTSNLFNTTIPNIPLFNFTLQLYSF